MFEFSCLLLGIELFFVPFGLVIVILINLLVPAFLFVYDSVTIQMRSSLLRCFLSFKKHRRHTQTILKEIPPKFQSIVDILKSVEMCLNWGLFISSKACRSDGKRNGKTKCAADCKKHSVSRIVGNKRKNNVGKNKNKASLL